MTSLHLVLRLNAASCLAFGALMTAGPDPVATFLGSVPQVVLTTLGAVLLVNGLHLCVASMRDRPSGGEVLWFSFGDLAWWLGSLALVAAGLWITTPGGVAVVLAVAAVVAALGTAQLFLLGLRRSGCSAGGRWRRIGRSWLALPLWVRIWLFALNAVFLGAPVFLPWSLASVVLLAYVASGPLLLAFAVLEGGMTRAMGIGHLVPWTPMLVWLTIAAPRPDADLLAFGYAVLLGAMTAICLAFDAHDLWRWYRGERGPLPIRAEGARTGRKAALC